MVGAASSRPKDERPRWLPSNGEIIGARYRVEALLGAGGMGAVAAAVDLKLTQNVAIKFLNPKLAHDAEQIGRFMREAQATSRIRTEHAVRVLDVGSTDAGLHYIVMERLEGTDLGDLVARGPLPIQLAVDCVLQAAEALAEAHAGGIVHRDIKPSNLWLSRRSDGSPLLKVLDFGISKLAPTSESDDPKLTETQAVFGSPTYMSPEQIRSAKKVDSSTDVWALGVVLHELLTATMPFEGESVAAVLASVAADSPAPLLAARPDAPPDLANAVLRCLEKDRARRSSLRDLAIRLRPHASLAGAICADRIMNAAPPTASLLPPPIPSSAARPVAFGETDAELAATQLAPAAAVRRTLTIAGVATVLAVGVVSGALAMKQRTSARSHDDTRPSSAGAAVSATSTSDPFAPPPSLSLDVAPQAMVPATGAPASSASAGAPRKHRAGVSASAARSAVAAEPTPPAPVVTVATPDATSSTSPTRR